MLNVDSDSLDLILSFLDARTAFRGFTRVCKRFAAVEAGTLGHMRQWCDDYTVDIYVAGCSDAGVTADTVADHSSEASPAKGPAMTLRQQFLHFVRDEAMGYCAHLYGPLAKAFRRYRHAVDGRLPPAELALLKPGLRRQRMEELWNSSIWAPRLRGGVIPPGVRAIFSVLDGIDLDAALPLSSLYGAYAVYDTLGWRVMCGFEFLCHWQQPLMTFPFLFEVTVQRWNSYFGVLLTGEEGQLEMNHDAVVSAPGLIVDILQRPTGDAIADYFLEFFNGVADGMYGIVDRHPSFGGRSHISLFPLSDADSRVASATTNGITIRASPLVLHAPSRRSRGVVCAYQIQMGMTGNSARGAAERPRGRAELTTRTWNIYEDGEHVDTVHGEGVIGFYPVLALLHDEERPHPDRSQYEWQRFDDDPSNASNGWFTYCSQTMPRRSEQGDEVVTSIGGHLTFKYVGSDETVDAVVNPCVFHLRWASQ
jgi:uncharacterized protein affecting Mg2+/Co2+ transport